MRIVDSSGYVFGELSTLLGCSQIVVSHDVFVSPAKRDQGLGNRAHIERLKYMRSLGYDYAICTVNMENKYQVKILETNDWDKLSEFYSTKTGHTVGLFGRKL